MTVNQVDRINGLVGSIAVKAPCKVATTAAITLSGAQTIDGVALTADETPRQRVLVKDQASDIENGIYDVNLGAWTRSPDFNGARDAVNGTQVLVNEGAAPLVAAYSLDATDPVAIGTDSLVFTAYPGYGFTLENDPSPTLGGDLDPGAYKFLGIPMSGAVNHARATVASHATTSAIWAAAANIINFTGAETLTDLPAAPQTGAWRIIEFAGAAVITNAGNFSVQGDANFTAEAGDLGLVEAITTTTFRWVFWKKDGTPVAYNLASPGDIGETAAGSVRGTNTDIYKTENADSPLTAQECAGTIVSNYGMTDVDCTIALPTAAEGLAFVCILPTVRAKFFHLDAVGGDLIYLNGVAGGAAEYIGVASGYATGTAISIFTFKASDGGYDWFAIPLFGTWVAE